MAEGLPFWWSTVCGGHLGVGAPLTGLPDLGRRIDGAAFEVARPQGKGHPELVGLRSRAKLVVWLARLADGGLQRRRLS